MRPTAVACILMVMLFAGCTQQDPPAPPAPAEDAHPLRSSAFTWTPAFPRVGDSVQFDPTIKSSKPDDELHGLLWRVEGAAYTVHRPFHAFRSDGVHEVELTVSTSRGGQYTVVREVTVLAAAPSTPGASPTTAPGPAPVPQPEIHVRQEGHIVDLAFTWALQAEAAAWSFGDGRASNETAPRHAYHSMGSFDIELRVVAGGQLASAQARVNVTQIPFVPHVIVGVPDSGFNVYHEVYRRPHLTAHPCTYIRDYPCDIPALNLTFDAPRWEDAFAADREKWAAIEPGQRFWIPGTNIIGAVCDQPYEGSNVGSTNPLGGVDHCLLDDTSMHGTGTSSSVLSENPDALLVVVEGNSGGADYLLDGFYPIDIMSFSWGAAVPLPVLAYKGFERTPIVVAASGNEGAFPVVLDGRKSHINVYNIGGADGASRTEPGYSSWKTMDFVSEYCRPTAQTRTFDGTRARYCGTSFSAPTFAGALSRVILELRRESGYTGGIVDDYVDPTLGITKTDLRRAVNHTASYAPTSPFASEPELTPLLDEAPYYQWGWGYYSRNDVAATLACLRQDTCPERPADTVSYMEAIWTYRQTLSDT